MTAFRPSIVCHMSCAESGSGRFELYLPYFTNYFICFEEFLHWLKLINLPKGKDGWLTFVCLADLERAVGFVWGWSV